MSFLQRSKSLRAGRTWLISQRDICTNARNIHRPRMSHSCLTQVLHSEAQILQNPASFAQHSSFNARNKTLQHLQKPYAACQPRAMRPCRLCSAQAWCCARGAANPCLWRTTQMPVSRPLISPTTSAPGAHRQRMPVALPHVIVAANLRQYSRAQNQAAICASCARHASCRANQTRARLSARLLA